MKGPGPEIDGVVRWRRIDLVRIAKARFDVSVDEDTMGRVLRELGFSPISWFLFKNVPREIKQYAYVYSVDATIRDVPEHIRRPS